MTPSQSKAARLWRVNHNLSRAELSERTGFAVETIYKYERMGLPATGGPGRPRTTEPEVIEPWVWQRYRLACAGVEAEIRSGRKFEWR